MHAYSVSEFVHGVNELLAGIPACVEGEVSNFHITQNRFVWFDLKDDKSYVSCFLLAFQLEQPLENGMQVQVIGRPALFVKSGKFHLRAQKIQIIGAGSWQRQYELLKAQLTTEGLFDAARKRPLPKFPRTIGLVTSADAAAYTDVLRILKNRWAGLQVLHFSVAVQGDAAIPSLRRAFQFINQSYARKLDVVIVTRGGGSMEDLQAFNDETVIRAVFGLKVPTVAAIGHERDVTLVEYAADVRAATPSNAAELVVPDKQDVLQQLALHAQRQTHAIQLLRRTQTERTTTFIQQLQYQAQQYVQTMFATQQRFLFATQQWQQHVQTLTTTLDHQLALLHSYDPKATLQRGYSITRTATGQLITSTTQVRSGTSIQTIVPDGTIQSQVI